MNNNMTLKKVKVMESLSEETICFSADLYENGKLMAHVSNRGQGGPNEVRPAKGLKYNDVAHLDTLDNEVIIMTMAEHTNTIKKSQGGSFVLERDGKIFTMKNSHSFVKLKKMRYYQAWLRGNLMKFKNDGYKVLNTNIGKN